MMKNGPSTSFLCIVFVDYLTTLLWAIGSINILYNIVQNSNSYRLQQIINIIRDEWFIYEKH